MGGGEEEGGKWAAAGGEAAAAGREAAVQAWRRAHHPTAAAVAHHSSSSSSSSGVGHGGNNFHVKVVRAMARHAKLTRTVSMATTAAETKPALAHAHQSEVKAKTTGPRKGPGGGRKLIASSAAVTDTVTEASAFFSASSVASSAARPWGLYGGILAVLALALTATGVGGVLYAKRTESQVPAAYGVPATATTAAAHV